MKTKLFKRLAACAVALITCAAMLPLNASAANPEVSYTIYGSGVNEGTYSMTNKKTTNYTIVTNNLMDSYSDGLTSGTYVVNSNTTINNRVMIQKGAVVDLVIQPNVTLTCNKGIGCGYNKNNKYATLNICGSGKLIANAADKNAAIGGDNDETSGDIRVHGCRIEATGGKHGAGIGGGEGGKDPDNETSIRIFKGDITATGGIDAAGIGGGDEQQGALTYIYDGKINAKSEKHGAGIGGGDEENTRGIYIYGGKITAKGGGHGAGIGAGEHGGNIHEIKITGGSIDTTGGSGGAGIGGGFDEDMSGEINISGDVHLTAKAGLGAAGIGAGSGALWLPDGDMCGTVRINGGANSDIKVYGINTDLLEKHRNDWMYLTYEDEYIYYDGAGIGSGYGGNMEGEVYITGGNMEIWSGVGGAGIGGGHENSKTGGEGGDVYIGGGNIKVRPVYYSEDGANHENNKSSNSAIGGGHWDEKEGSVYIHPNNNTTGKYMKVVRTPIGDFMDEFKPTVTEKASDRSHNCHTKAWLDISECDHKDHDGNSGLSYTIEGDKHRVKCKYCGYDALEEHDGSVPCGECGYKSDVVQHAVTLKTQHGDPVQSEITVQHVADGQKFTFPECNQIPTGKRFAFWQESDGNINIIPSGYSITPNSDVTFEAVYADLYSITYDHQIPNDNWISLNKTAADEDDEITVKANPYGGYRMKTVTVRKNDENGEILYEKEVEQGKDQCSFTMPANDIYVTAEFEEAGYSVQVNDSENGTVTADPPSIAYTAFDGGATPKVVLTVTPDEGYNLSKLICKTESGVEIVPTQDGEPNEYTFEMPKENVKVTAEFDITHNLSKINAVASAGDIEYWHCDDVGCDKYYSEVGGEYTEINDEDTCNFLEKAEKALTVNNTNDVIAQYNQAIAEEGYIGTRFLGVQKAALNGEETKDRSLRFITEISSDILETLNDDNDADYGFVFAALKADSESTYDKLTIDHQSARKYSCKGTFNTLSGDYGNNDYTSTDYKYVTAAINDIPANAKLVARFYITYNGTTYYINYANRNGVTGTAFDADTVLNS